jgi:hypothetical protein
VKYFNDLGWFLLKNHIVLQKNNAMIDNIPEWAQENRPKLLENWTLCANHQTPKTIPPLA